MRRVLVTGHGQNLPWLPFAGAEFLQDLDRSADAEQGIAKFSPALVEFGKHLESLLQLAFERSQPFIHRYPPNDRVLRPTHHHDGKENGVVYLISHERFRAETMAGGLGCRGNSIDFDVDMLGNGIYVCGITEVRK